MDTLRIAGGGTTATVFPRRDPDRDEANPRHVPLTDHQRKRMATRMDSATDGARLWGDIDEREKRKRTAYEALSLKTVKSDGDVDLGPGVGGAVRELSAIGGDTVWLAKGDEDLFRLREEIGSDYFVAPNAPLFAPNKLGVLQSVQLQAMEEREQPDPFATRYGESGIARAPRLLGGRGVFCGVLDSGIDADHKDFQHRHRNNGRSVRFGFVLSDNKLHPPAEGRGFDLYGHGTHIASIIGGRLGVAPACGLIVAGTPRTRLTSSVVMLHTGLNWLFEKMADEGDWGYPLVLNLSLGFPDPGDADAPADPLYLDAVKTFDALLDAVIAQDILVVSAIGNAANKYVSPGCRHDVLSVGAVDGNNMRAPWSGHVVEGSRTETITGPRVMGYGAQVVAAQSRRTHGDHLWVSRSGTSQAAAYVSGIAALYWAETPNMPALDIAGLIEDKALPLRDGGVRCGKGLARYVRRSGVSAP